MEVVVERENILRAMHRVEQNKGAAGIDDVATTELRSYLIQHWPRVKRELIRGDYQPQPVLRVEIPKPGGGARQLGIPTVLDRLIQQAVHQVLSPIFEPLFSESSFGFRPGRSAHMAVRQAQRYVSSGKRWVVDMDLEQFFDRVNHDILMSRVARRVKDKRVLLLIRRYLQVGVMEGKTMVRRTAGTPQGAPLSPLLSNILLDDLDKELERRGHTFCRYADDANIYVGSRKAGERTLNAVTRFLWKRLKLRINQGKSGVDRPWKREFLGYSITPHKQPRLKVSPKSVRRIRAKLKAAMRKGRGCNVKRLIDEVLTPLLRGWMNYFRLSAVKNVFEDLDGWIRRRLRGIKWRQWKRPVARRKKLMARGLDESRASQSAYNGHGPWWNSGKSHMNTAFPKHYFDSLGLVSLLVEFRRFQSTI